MRFSTRSGSILCYSRFGILASCTYAVKELATCAKVEAKVQIMSSLRDKDERQVPVHCGDSHLEVIVQCDDVGMADRHPLQYSNLVTDLRGYWLATMIRFQGSG